MAGRETHRRIGWSLSPFKPFKRTLLPRAAYLRRERGLLTSASLHDSQAAIPLAKLTAARLTNLYDLMDSAYDAPEIAQTSRDLGHVPIIDKNPRRTPGAKAELEAETRRQRYAGYRLAEDLRYNFRLISVSRRLQVSHRRV